MFSRAVFTESVNVISSDAEHFWYCRESPCDHQEVP